jgi:L-asparagine transporter-like permease
MGWNYWYNWTIILPAELSAAAILINYWNKEVNNAAWISICLAVVVAINMCGAGMYSVADRNTFRTLQCIVMCQACMENANLYLPVSKSLQSQVSSFLELCLTLGVVPTTIESVSVTGSIPGPLRNTKTSEAPQASSLDGGQ